jgi:hypothetical protein
MGKLRKSKEREREERERRGQEREERILMKFESGELWQLGASLHRPCK